MTNRHRGWRAWLAAAVSAGLASAGTLAAGRATDSLPSVPDPGASLVVTRPVPPVRQALPPAVVLRQPAEDSPAAAPGDRARRHGLGRLGPDGPGGQLQLPAGRGISAVPGAWHRAVPGAREAGLFLPAWRALLESRWRERLGTVTELSVAYHDAAERSGGERDAGGHRDARHLRQLMREAVAARRALSDTEEALARLPAGSFGRCEHCAAAIPVARLARAPEARYCARCAEPRLASAGGPGVAGYRSALPAAATQIRSGVIG